MEYTKSKFPYSTWINAHTRILNYSSRVSYSKNAIISLNKSIYRSTIDNNKSNPLTNKNWIKLY